MKKITLLLSLLTFVATSAFASVSFTGVALSGINDVNGNAIAGGSTATFFSLQGLDSSDYDSIFASYEAASIGSSTYTAGFFGSTAGHISGINLDAGFTTGDSFGIVVTDASTGLDSFFADAGWVAPNDGFTVAGTTYTGNALATVPEPSTYALIAGFAAFVFVAIRRRK